MTPAPRVTGVLLEKRLATGSAAPNEIRSGLSCWMCASAHDINRRQVELLELRQSSAGGPIGCGRADGAGADRRE